MKFKTDRNGEITIASCDGAEINAPSADADQRRHPRFRSDPSNEDDFSDMPGLAGGGATSATPPPPEAAPPTLHRRRSRITSSGCKTRGVNSGFRNCSAQIISSIDDYGTDLDEYDAGPADAFALFGNTRSASVQCDSDGNVGRNVPAPFPFSCQWWWLGGGAGAGAADHGATAAAGTRKASDGVDESSSRTRRD